jgi:hypothetical protein
MFNVMEFIKDREVEECDHKGGRCVYAGLISGQKWCCLTQNCITETIACPLKAYRSISLTAQLQKCSRLKKELAHV